MTDETRPVVETFAGTPLARVLAYHQGGRLVQALVAYGRPDDTIGYEPLDFGVESLRVRGGAATEAAVAEALTALAETLIDPDGRVVERRPQEAGEGDVTTTDRPETAGTLRQKLFGPRVAGGLPVVAMVPTGAGEQLPAAVVGVRVEGGALRLELEPLPGDPDDWPAAFAGPAPGTGPGA